jgi:hypothetical protein
VEIRNVTVGSTHRNEELQEVRPNTNVRDMFSTPGVYIPPEPERIRDNNPRVRFQCSLNVPDGVSITEVPRGMSPPELMERLQFAERSKEIEQMRKDLEEYLRLLREAEEKRNREVEEREENLRPRRLFPEVTPIAEPRGRSTAILRSPPALVEKYGFDAVGVVVDAITGGRNEYNGLQVDKAMAVIRDELPVSPISEAVPFRGSDVGLKNPKPYEPIFQYNEDSWLIWKQEFFSKAQALNIHTNKLFSYLVAAISTDTIHYAKYNYHKEQIGKTTKVEQLVRIMDGCFGTDEWRQKRANRWTTRIR